MLAYIFGGSYTIMESKHMEHKILYQLQDMVQGKELTMLCEYIKEAIREELSKHNHTCILGLSKQEAPQITESLRVIKLMNSEDFRENNKWLSRQRQRSDRIATAFIFAVIASVASGIAWAVWHGLKELINSS